MVLPAVAAVAGRVASTGTSSIASGASKGVASTIKTTRKSGLSSTSQIKSQLQQARRQKTDEETQPEPVIGQTFIATSPTSQWKQMMAMARILQTRQTSPETEDAEAQELARLAAQKVIPRATLFLANHVATALELSTAGTAFVVTWIARLITLGWLNVEMIYGRWIAKGKNKFIPPIAWDPIPMPIDKQATILQIIVILADIICIIMVLLPFILPILILGAIMESVTSVF